MRVVGVDLGTRKIAWSVWEDGVLVETDEYVCDEPQRQRQLHVTSSIFRNVALLLNPDCIFIEDVLIGNNRKYSMQLAEMKGAVLSQLQGFDVYMVNVSTWKKEVIGSGKADKDAIRKYLWERDSAYAELCGQSQDRFDAACIGYYGVVCAHRVQLLEGSRSARS